MVSSRDIGFSRATAVYGLISSLGRAGAGNGTNYCCQKVFKSPASDVILSFPQISLANSFI